METQILKEIGIALILSGLVGLEREKRAQTYEYESFAGFRTYILIGLLGVFAFVFLEISVVLSAVIFVGAWTLIAISYYISTQKAKGYGLTSEIAAFLVFIIGFLCAMNLYVVATSLTLLIVVILQFKERLHSWVRNVSGNEFISTLQFILIAFVVLPILPNGDFGPYGFFNPYIVWLMVVFISGISFASYIMIKILGTKKGISLTGFLAGLMSSTALAFSFSELSKKNESIVRPYVVAILVAISAMFFRVVFILAVINPAVLMLVLVPLAVMGIVGFLLGGYFYFAKGKRILAQQIEENIELKNPFRLSPALKFGALFAVVLLLSSFLNDQFGEAGIYVSSVFSSFFDINAISVSLANLARDTIAVKVASIGIVIAVMTNVVIKSLIFLLLGARKVALRILASCAVILLFGALSLIFL